MFEDRIFHPRTGKPVVGLDVDGKLIAGAAALKWIVRTGQAEECHVIRGLPREASMEDVMRALEEGDQGENEGEEWKNV